MKNIQSDVGDEVRINFDLDHDLSCALSHDKLMANKLNPFVEAECDRQGGVNNPTINTDRSKNESWLRDNFNQYNLYQNQNQNPFGLEVVKYWRLSYSCLWSSGLAMANLNDLSAVKNRCHTSS
jgi:hypothetical protein